MEVFDFVHAILQNGKDLMQEPKADKIYVPFLINRALSYHPDTALAAIEMNLCPNLDKDMQFYYLLNTVKKKKRQYVKWGKPSQTENLELLQKHYGYSKVKAEQALAILTDEQIVAIKNKIKTGGVVK